MMIILRTDSWLRRGAIVPTDDELEAMIHVMVSERDMVTRGDGNQYGRMTIQELDECITKLIQYQKERGN